MWQLGQPLIEDWIAHNLGPQAQLRSVVEDGLDVARRLPHLVERVERTLEAVADGGLKLHPTSLAALLGPRSKGAGALPWILCLILAGLVLGLLIG
jgi:ubiquinone biosynthesis protein